MSSDKPEPKRKKRGLLFKLFVLFAGLFVLLVLVLALLPYVISLESVKKVVIEQVGKALNRKVELGEVRLSLLTGPGAALEDLIVHSLEGWEREHFIKVGRASVKLELIPLLSGDVRVTRVLLKDGEIVVERDSGGRLSIDDLIGAEAAPEAAPEPGPGGGSGSGTDLSSLAGLLISKVVVDNVDLAFVDRAVVPGRTVETKVSDLDVELTDIALGKPISLKLSAKLLTEASDNLAVTGTIGPIPADLDFNKVEVDVSVTLGTLPLSGVGAYLGPDLKFERGSLELAVRAKGSIGAGHELSVSGSLTDLDLRDGQGGRLVALKEIAFGAKARADLTKSEAQLAETRVSLLGIEAIATGSVKGWDSEPELDLTLRTNEFNLGAALKELPLLATVLPAPVRSAGVIRLDATVKGKASNLDSKVRIETKGLSVEAGSFAAGRKEDGGLLLKVDSAIEATAAIVGGQEPEVTFEVKVTRLVLDQVAPAASAETASELTPTSKPAEREEKKEPTEPQPIEIPVKLSGKLEVKEARVMQFEFTDLVVEVSAADQILQIAHRLALYRGLIEGGAKVDLTKASPSVSLRNKITGLDVAGILKAVDPSLNLLGQGTLASNLKVDGVLDGTVSVVGEITVENATLIDPAGGEPFPLPRVVVIQNVTADLGRETLELSEVKVSTAGVEAKVSGTVSKFLSDPTLEVALSTNTFDPGALAKQVPMVEAILGKPLSLKGNVGLQAKVSGPLSDIQSHVTLAVPALYLKSGSFNGGEAKVGGMLLETDEAKVDLGVRLKGSEPPNVQFAFDAKRVLFDQKSAAAVPAPKPETPVPTPKPDTEPTPPSEGLELPPLTARGTARIAGGRITYLTFQDLVADISLVDGKASSDVSFGLYGGRFETKVGADLAGKTPEYDLKVKLAQINLGGLLGEFLPAQNLLSGLVGTEFGLSGKGLTWDVISKSLNADGSFAVTEVRGLEGMQKAAGALQSIGSLAGFTVPADLGTRTFKDLLGSFSLRDGRVRTEDLKLLGKDLQGLLKGSIGLDMSIDMDGRLVFLEKLVSKFGKKAKFLQDEQGDINLPLKIGGTLFSPKVSVSTDGLMAMVKKALASEAKGKLADELIKNLPDDKKGPLGDILRGVLESGKGDDTTKDDGSKDGDTKKDDAEKKGDKVKGVLGDILEGVLESGNDNDAKKDEGNKDGETKKDDGKKKPEDQVKDVLRGLFK